MHSKTSDYRSNEVESSAIQGLESVYTSNLPEILNEYKISLVVSTYQAGKVILIRNNGGVISTHFRNFNKPMGIAADNNRLTIGGANTVWFYRNMPAAAPELDSDACYLPDESHVTGDIDIHEMAYDSQGQLWVVNTRFSTLCTIDSEHRFSPVWQPQYVSALLPQDRCHLNGLAMVEGRPKFVTALGETDLPGGWRENKKNAGILIDVETNDVVLRGLSMPHSPRWHTDRLWLLESGQGSLVAADLDKGNWETVCRLPGFTRGISFAGPLAFIGLSQVRESAIFSGIPLVDRAEERHCGVWVVDTRTGRTAAFLRFESGVREIFAVQVIPAQYPEILEWQDVFLTDQRPISPY